MKVTYRDGYPSLKTIQDAWQEYNPKMSLNFKDSYKYTHCINWGSGNTCNLIDGFVLFLNENGIKTGKFRNYDYDNAITGSLEILPK